MVRVTLLLFFLCLRWNFPLLDLKLTGVSLLRYFPYYITVAALVVVFVGLLLYLIFQRRLLPSIVMIGGFVLFVLWMVGLIVVSIELWGPTGSVSSNCNLAVFNQNPTGQSLQTLAWLEQRSICVFPAPRCWSSYRGQIADIGSFRSIMASCLRLRLGWSHFPIVDHGDGVPGLCR